MTQANIGYWNNQGKVVKSYFDSRDVGTSKKMASGVTLQESEKQKPDGFFPKLYENICKTMSEKDLDTMPDEKADNDQFIR